jgi:hypothetical protein
MKQLLATGLILLSTVASAECYMRQSINLRTQQVNSGAKDIQKLVTPDPQGFKCVIQYRVHIDNNWQTAEGIGIAKTEQEACIRANDIQRSSLLVEVTGVSADNQMVCSDFPEIRVRPVKIGEVVWETETDLHTIPTFQKTFTYKRSLCRLFAERDIRNQNLMLYQGVVCRIDNMANSKWRVIDKY